MTSQYQPYGGGPAPEPMRPADEKLWATLIHLSGFVLSFVGPLVGYLVLKDRGPFVRAHTATALNFQLTLLIAGLAGTLLTFILIGFVILFVVSIVGIVFPIIAAVRANQGQWYQYPAVFRFVS